MKALLILGLAMLLIAGCTTTPSGNVASSSSRSQSNPGQNRFRGNLTQEQIKQFMQQRIDACTGKQQNDACMIQNPRGNLSGTCQTQNSTFECMPQRRAP